ncbi:MAG: MBL fold metallo-hydrolase [Myxococcota bacterium]
MPGAEPQFMVRYWGVRGSIPTPGPETVRYGGNTTCIDLRCDGRILIIDTGTGARKLGQHLLAEADGTPLRVHILYSHLHLDHIQGFPFFAPLYSDDAELHVHSAVRTDAGTRDVLAAQMTYPSFPVGLSHVPADLRFHDVRPGEPFEVAGVRVDTCPIPHPGGALAFRIEHRGHVYVHSSDIEPTGPRPEPQLVELARGADFLSYDSTYSSPEEYERHRGWGHGTWQAGVDVAEAAGVDRFVAFHHDPNHDDDFMDGVAEALEAARPGSLVAREGMTLDLLTGRVSGPEEAR